MGEYTKVVTAAIGAQAHLVFTKVPAGSALLGVRLLDAGAIALAGAYECEFEIGGAADVEAHLKPSAVTGAFAPSLVIPYANRAEEKTTVAGANFAAGVLQSLATSSPKGAQYAQVRFTVPGGGSVTFAQGADPYAPSAIAEYNCG